MMRLGFKLLLILSLSVFAFADQVRVNFNKEVSFEIFNTVELIYKNTDDMRRYSLYIEVEDEYEMSFMVDRKDARESEYTIMSLKHLNTSLKDRLFVIRIDKDGKMYLIGDDNLLTVDEIIKKQDAILRMLKAYHSELMIRYDKKIGKENYIKDKFMKL